MFIQTTKIFLISIPNLKKYLMCYKKRETVSLILPIWEGLKMINLCKGYRQYVAKSVRSP